MARNKDRVNLKLGPRRFDSPKAIRDLSRFETQQALETATAAVIDAVESVSVGGVLELASVIAYDDTTGVGIADTGEEIYFVNGTLQLLEPGDFIAVGRLRFFSWYVAIGVF
jgi:hypothetical protein